MPNTPQLVGSTGMYLLQLAALGGSPATTGLGRGGALLGVSHTVGRPGAYLLCARWPLPPELVLRVRAFATTSDTRGGASAPHSLGSEGAYLGGLLLPQLAPLAVARCSRRGGGAVAHAVGS